MPRFNTEEQFKFLISCIRYSNNGRINFEEVANECGIVSKGAAAKRYERMMKAHSIGVDADNEDGDTPTAAAPRKKRKRPEAAGGGDGTNVDEATGGEAKVRKTSKSAKVKAEDRVQTTSDSYDGACDEQVEDDDAMEESALAPGRASFHDLYAESEAVIKAEPL